MSVLKIVLEAGASKNFALVEAARNGRLEMLEFLVKKGADIHTENDAALNLAAFNGFKGVVDLLINAGMPGCAKNGALSSAAKHGHFEVVKLLLDAGADCRDRSALSSAAKHGHFEVVKLLLDARADCRDGSALSSAAKHGHFEVVKLLLDAGADCRDGSALSSAAKHGNFEVSKLLLDAGANYHDGNALCQAALHGHIEVVELLLVQADQRAEGDNNSLSYAAVIDMAFINAAAGGNLAVIERLIKAGAHVGTENNAAIRRAIVRQDYDVVQLLVNAGADVVKSIREARKYKRKDELERLIKCARRDRYPGRRTAANDV